MPKSLSKKDIKEVVIEVIEPFSKAVQKDFQTVNNRLDKVDGRFDKVDGRFDKMELQLDNVESDLKEVKEGVKLMKENSSQLFEKIDKFIKLYEDQKQELLILSAHLKRLEERVIKLENQRA